MLNDNFSGGQTLPIMGELGYRIGVVGVFVNKDGFVLVCERLNQPGAWQFPQGGIDPGEEPDTALLREMLEELGTDKLKILEMAEEMTQYDFPSDLDSRITQDYCGQRHYWYRLEFHDGAEPDLSKSDGEFSQWKWVSIEDSLRLVVPWKRDVYHKGLSALNLLKVKKGKR